MEAKPFASLSSGLLARKGQAKPAMRPQGFNGFGAPTEDLGWNDMGFDAPRVAPADAPAVVHQQVELAQHFAPVDEEPVVEAPIIEAAVTKVRRPKAEAVLAGHKAAFTLRLDEDRHLRLRLASALNRRSSQRLVTEALDALLNGMQGLDEMVAKARHGNMGKANA
jgi:hypothetical protein